MPLLFAPIASLLPFGEYILVAHILSHYSAPDECLVDAAQEFLEAMMGKDGADEFIEGIDIYR